MCENDWSVMLSVFDLACLSCVTGKDCCTLKGNRKGKARDAYQAFVVEQDLATQTYVFV